MVTWGRAWRGAGARLGWNIVWGIAGFVVFGIGVYVAVSAFLPTYDPYYGYTSYNNPVGGLIGGIVLMIIGYVVASLGSWATFFKINSEIMSEEVCKQLGRMGAQPPAADAAATVCPSCGGPLLYDFQSKRWYCQREARYL